MMSFGRLLRAVEQLFLYCAMASLLLMMALVSVDAVMRHFFSRPLTFQFELTENYLMVAAILLPLAYVTRERQHIAIHAFQKHLPRALMKVLHGAGIVAMIALLAVVTYVSGMKAYDAFRLSETMFGVIDWPIGWSRILVPLGCGLFMVRLAHDLIGGLRNGRTSANAEEHS